MNSIRFLGCDLLKEFSKMYKHGGSGAIYSGSTKLLSETGHVSISLQWRLKEAGLLALGQISRSLVSVCISFLSMQWLEL